MIAFAAVVIKVVAALVVVFVVVVVAVVLLLLTSHTVEIWQCSWCAGQAEHRRREGRDLGIHSKSPCFFFLACRRRRRARCAAIVAFAALC